MRVAATNVIIVAEWNVIFSKLLRVQAGAVDRVAPFRHQSPYLPICEVWLRVGSAGLWRLSWCRRRWLFYGLPIQVEAGEVFAKAVGIVGGFAVRAGGGEEFAAGVGKGG